MQRKSQLWSQTGLRLLRELPLQPRASCRREDLLGLLSDAGSADRGLGPSGTTSRRSQPAGQTGDDATGSRDRKSTRLNSSHVKISYAVFCLEQKMGT